MAASERNPKLHHISYFDRLPSRRPDQGTRRNIPTVSDCFFSSFLAGVSFLAGLTFFDLTAIDSSHHSMHSLQRLPGQANNRTALLTRF